jgi:Asp-tRNA(Asn)/Glu-tRNA(Gln) amidotransferase A subunit family amidase
LRVAFTTITPNGAPVESEYINALHDVAQLCATLGHHVIEANPDIEREAVIPTFLTLMAANTAVNIASHPTAGRPARQDEVEKVTWGSAQMATRINAADYVRATQTAHRLGRQMAAFHAHYDVLLTPALAMLPPKLGWIDMMMDDVDEYWRRVFAFSPFTVWFNITGQPAIVLPLGQSDQGLPLSVQFVAPYADEATLFRLASQLEAAQPWFDRKPAMVTQ